jgi:predicted transcriptional regulator
LSEKESKILSIEENRRYHRHYFLAVNNPIRRRILRAIKEGYKTVDAIKNETGFEVQNLEWHLKYLKHYLCIEKKNINGKQEYKLTKEGEIINYLEK